MNKLPVIYRQSLRRFFVSVGIAALTFAVLQLISTLITGFGDGWQFVRLGDTVSSWLSGTGTVVVLIYGVMYLSFSYRDFKLGMQSGQTRQRIWLGEVASLATTTVFIWLMWECLSQGSFTWTNFFGSLLMIICLITPVFAIGSGFALLPRKWKIVVAIALPTLCMFLLIQLIKIMVTYWRPSQNMLETLGNIVSWPGSWVICGLLWSAIMLALSYVFTMHLQLRRD